MINVKKDRFAILETINKLLLLCAFLTLLLIIYDFYVYRYETTLYAENNFTDLSSVVSILLLCMSFFVGVFYKNKVIILIFMLFILEAVGDSILKNNLHVNYVTSLVALSYIIYSFLSQTTQSKMNEKYFSKINWKTIVILSTIMYFFGYFYFNGFTSYASNNVLGDYISTWLLGGWDQSAYNRMVLQLIDGSGFNGGYNGGYFYPIGYPLLGAIGYYFNSGNPFLLFNVFAYVVSMLLFYLILKKYTNNILGLIGTIFIGLQSPLLSIDDYYMRSFIVPYNNITTLLGGMVVLYYAFNSNILKHKDIIIISFVVSLVFASRYGDVLFLSPILLYIFVFKTENKIKSFIIFAIPFTIVLSCIFYLNYLYYGDILTTYHQFTGKHEFWFHPFAFGVHVHKILEMFLFPFLGEPNQTASLLMPIVYAIFLPFGIYKLVKQEKKYLVLAILLMITLNILYFTSTDAVNAVQIKYDNFRYFGVGIFCMALLSIIGFFYVIKELNLNLNILLFISIVLMIVSIFIVNNKKSIIDLKNIKVDVTFEGTDDLVTKKHYPNYGKDGFVDYKFKVKIDSVVPIILTSVSVIGPHGGEFKSENISGNLTALWGVGVINEYGKDIKFAWGDNLYKNNYINGNKEIILAIPIPTQSLVGEYVFNIKTTNSSDTFKLLLDESKLRSIK